MNQPDPATQTREQLLHELEQMRSAQAELARMGTDLVAAQTRMQSLLHRSSDAIIQFRDDDTVESFNPSAERIFGLLETDVVGCSIAHLFPHPDNFSGDVRDWLAHYAQSTSNQYEHPLEAVNADGVPVLLEVSIATIEQDDFVLFEEEEETPATATDQGGSNYQAFMCILRDITERKALDEELRSYKQELEALVQQHARHLPEQQTRASSPSPTAQATPSTLAALRAPLLAFQALCDGMLDDEAQHAGYRVPHEPLRKIRQDGEQLLRLVDQLVVSEGPAEEPDAAGGRLQDTDLVQLIAPITRACTPLLESKDLRLHVRKIQGLDTYAHLDPKGIGRVIETLLVNACRFSPHRGEIELRLIERPLAKATGDMGIGIRISDQGPGIEPDQVDRLLQGQPQEDAKTGTATLQTTLAQCREIIEAHGGRLWAKNRQNTKGAVITFLLPRHPPPPTARFLPVDDD